MHWHDHLPSTRGDIKSKVAVVLSGDKVVSVADPVPTGRWTGLDEEDLKSDVKNEGMERWRPSWQSRWMFNMADVRSSIPSDDLLLAAAAGGTGGGYDI